VNVTNGTGDIMKKKAHALVLIVVILLYGWVRAVSIFDGQILTFDDSAARAGC